jgi:hypothetical protein
VCFRKGTKQRLEEERLEEERLEEERLEKRYCCYPLLPLASLPLFL